MGRRSAADLAASLWREAGPPPPPPRGIGQRAARVWRDAVASLPGDVLKPAALPLVRAYATLAVVAEDLEKLVLANPRNEKARGELRKTAACLMSLATKLRLAPSSRLRAADGRIAERNLAAIDDGLIGGDCDLPGRFQ